MEKIGGSRVDTEPTAWGLDVQVWNLLWTGEKAMKKGIPILKKAGFESVEDLPRTAVGFSSKAYQDLPPQLRLSAASNGEQRVRVRVPNAQGLHCTTQFLMQSYSYWALGGVGSTSQNSKVQDGGKSRHAKRGASNVQGAALSKSLVRTFTRCNWVEVASA